MSTQLCKKEKSLYDYQVVSYEIILNVANIYALSLMPQVGKQMKVEPCEDIIIFQGTFTSQQDVS